MHIFSIKNTTEEEISHTIRNMKNTNSIGFDNIPISVIKNNTTHLKKSITSIINKSITDGIVPQNLKISKVTPTYIQKWRQTGIQQL